jgi:serine phosphatase RsbU (regulator of sigma subunit)
MIYLIRRGFRGGGYEFSEAHDGDEALRVMKKNIPDLVLLDLKMPKMYGIDVLDEMKKRESMKDIPVIVLTVVDDTQEKISALRAGANDFLVKPPVTEELKARVKTHLKLREATSALIEYSKHLEEKVRVIREQHEELLRDIESAHKIQRGMLPGRFPDIPGIRFTIRYNPCLAVGGDFYDVFRIDENTIGFFIADVSGHGVPSAMITVFLKQEVGRAAKRLSKRGAYSVSRPGEVLERLNASFISLNLGEGGFFVTMVYCTYRVDQRILDCSIAGHHALPILKNRDGTVKTIEIPGFPIGWFPDKPGYDERRYNLGKGDTLFLYTDGLLDLVDEEPGERSYLARVETFFRRNRNPLAEFDRLYERGCRKGSLRDDVTLLSFSLSS